MLQKNLILNGKLRERQKAVYIIATKNLNSLGMNRKNKMINREKKSREKTGFGVERNGLRTSYFLNEIA